MSVKGHSFFFILPVAIKPILQMDTAIPRNDNAMAPLKVTITFIFTTSNIILLTYTTASPLVALNVQGGCYSVNAH